MEKPQLSSQVWWSSETLVKGMKHVVHQPNGLLTKAEPDEALALEYDASSLEFSALEKECYCHTKGLL
jgi:hypothetical protein